MNKNLYVICHVLCIAILGLSACAPILAESPTPTAIPIIETPKPIKPRVPNFPTETPSAFGKYQIPVYYSESYISIVENSKKEDGLVIYSIMAENNWKPIIETFNAHYPWIKVTTEDLGAAEVFTRYFSETEQNTRSADIVVSSDPVNWLSFFDKKQVLPYRSQEDLQIPDWSKSSYGTYTVSSDPMVLIYNKKLVSTPPQSIADLVNMVKSNPAVYKNQIVTYDAELNATGFAINWFWAKKMGNNGWNQLQALGAAHPVLMTSGGKMVDAVGKGEAKLGYFVSAITVFPKLETYPDLGWAYISDGQPILLRNMAITQKAASPNSAKLMLDFILSQEGQYALGLGGLTPYRNDISGVSENHFNKISIAVGENDMIIFSFDTDLLTEETRTSFIEHWKAAVQKPPAPTPTP